MVSSPIQSGRMRTLIDPGPISGDHVIETSKTHGLEGSPHRGEWYRQQPGDASEDAALMAQLNDLLQLLGIERPPLVAAPAASIYQGSDTTGAVLCKLLVRGAQADPRLRRKISQWLSVLNVSTHKSYPTDSGQSGIGVGMHGL